MKNLIKGALLAGMLLVGVSILSAQVSIGIQIGPPPPPRVVRVLPPRPAAEFTWVGGYWYPVGRAYRWHDGYWTRPPYEGAHWVAPRHDGRMFFAGYWEGDRGRVEHDHKWDKDHDRDFRENPGQGRGNGHDKDDKDRDHR